MSEIEELQLELKVIKKLYAEACQASYDFGTMRAQLSEAHSLFLECFAANFTWPTDLEQRIENYLDSYVEEIE